MKWPGLIAEENIAALLVHALRSAGWDVCFVAESWPGIDDDAVLEKARSESRVLLTEDRDFGELVFRMKQDVPDVILVRLLRPFGVNAGRD